MINNKLKTDDMHIIKYRKDIQNIAKHVSFYCQRLFFKFQNVFGLRSYIKKTF
jgi:hypothetical protein